MSTEKKIVYSEPEGYFSEGIRKKHNLGEYAGDSKDIVTQMVDAVVGKEKESLTDEAQKKQNEIRKKLSGRVWEYLMFIDD